jgi:hypothetical protein
MAQQHTTHHSTLNLTPTPKLHTQTLSQFALGKLACRTGFDGCQPSSSATFTCPGRGTRTRNSTSTPRHHSSQLPRVTQQHHTTHAHTDPDQLNLFLGTRCRPVLSTLHHHPSWGASVRKHARRDTQAATQLLPCNVQELESKLVPYRLREAGDAPAAACHTPRAAGD